MSITDNNTEKEEYSVSGEILPYSDKYVPEEEVESANNEDKKASDERYNEIFSKSKHKTRLWSLISLVLAIASLVCCFFGWVGLILAISAVAMALVSRKLLGYFDGLSMAGFISGIFGAVFSTVRMLIEALI